MQGAVVLPQINNCGKHANLMGRMLVLELHRTRIPRLKTMTLVTLCGHIKVPITALEAVRAELPNHIALTRSEPGCLRFEVEVDPTDPTVFHVNEEFSEPLSFTNHQERVRSSKWGAITANVERFYEITGMPDS